MEFPWIIHVSFPICDLKKLDTYTKHLRVVHSMRCFDHLMCSYFLTIFDIFLLHLILPEED